MLKNLTENSNQFVVYNIYRCVHTEADRVTGRINMIQSSFSFIRNTKFLVVLSKKRDLVKKKRITYNVGNLALADALFGLSQFCYKLETEVTIGPSIFWHMSGNIANGVSVVSLSAVLLMAIERAVVIRKLFTWVGILPLKKMLFVISATWIATLLIVVMKYFAFPKLLLPFTLVQLLIICLTITVYIYIYNRLQIEKKSSKEILNNQEKPRSFSVRLVYWYC